MYHPDDNNNFFEELSQHMSVRTTNSKFNGVAYDQKHENNNKEIKSTGGYINLVNKDDKIIKTHLRKLEICLPEVLQYLEMVEGQTGTSKHKEETDSFSAKLLRDCKTVSSRIETNPFLEETFKKLNSSVHFPDVIVRDCDKVFKIGNMQYQAFVRTRFILGSVDVVTSRITLICHPNFHRW